MKTILTILGLIALIGCGKANVDTIPSYYIPSYDSSGNLDIKQLNKAIILASLQSNKKLVIEHGVYFFENNTTIELQDSVEIICNSVYFNVTIDGNKPVNNIININNKNNCSIQGLNIITFSKTKDIQGKWETNPYFANKSIIQVYGSKNITLNNLNITRIFGSGVSISNSSYVTLSNSKMYDSFTFGGESGTQGYMVNIDGEYSKNNHIYNNELKKSRHQIVVQYNANNNLIENNKTSESQALKKILWWYILDKTFGYSITLHGNGAYENTFKGNYVEGNLIMDNVKDFGNGKGNQFIENTVKGAIEVQSFYPYTYNQGQIIKNNRYKSISVKAKNCIVEGNKKL